MSFENLTIVPIDDKGIDRSIMTERELSEYVAFQKSVYEKLEPHLSEDERSWLREYAGL